MFGAWIHPGEHLNFSTKATTLKTEHAATNLDWKIVGTWIERIGGDYNSSKNATYPSLHYAFFLERHSASFTALVTVPALRKLGIMIGIMDRIFSRLLRLQSNIDCVVSTSNNFSSPVCCFSNLIALFLDLFSTERFVMITVNILVHFFLLQSLLHNAPSNGDTAPKIGTNRIAF